MTTEASSSTPSCVQAYPDEVIARIEQGQLEIINEIKNSPDKDRVDQLSFVLNKRKLWPQREIVTIAFNGGDFDTRRAVYEAAMQWDQYTNLTLDFGYSPETLSFREWSTSDLKESADIRIGFDKVGYWSAVGTDCNVVFLPSETTMSLDGFDENLPRDYIGTVIHEFGHALGCEHEHQIPVGGCGDEFKWEDDDGYLLTRDRNRMYVPDRNGKRPGLYTYFTGAPNFWPAHKVDYNLRNLPEGDAFLHSDSMDKTSIMRYTFPPSYFRTGSASFCYLNWVPQRPSDLDKEGMRLAYPQDPDSMAAIAQENQPVIEGLLSSGNINDELLIKSLRREASCHSKILNEQP